MHVVCFDIDGTLVASADFDADLYAETIQDVLGVAIETDWSQYENVTDSGILEEILEKHSSPGQRGERDARGPFDLRGTYQALLNGEFPPYTGGSGCSCDSAGPTQLPGRAGVRGNRWMEADRRAKAARYRP